jgi:hypothetical protein
VLIGYNGKDTNKFALFSRTVGADTTLSDIVSWIDQAVADRTWLILDFHQILPADVSNPESIYATTPETLAGIVDYLKTKNVPVHTVRDGIALMDGTLVTPPPAPSPLPTPTPTPPPSGTTTPPTATTTASGGEMRIFDITTLGSGLSSMIVKWKTSLPATSQLIYDVVAHPTLDIDLPNFGYAFTTSLESAVVTEHRATIDNVLSETIYYARPVTEVIAGDEVSFTLGESSTTPPVLTRAPAPTPAPSPEPTPTPTREPIPAPTPPSPQGTVGSNGGGGSATFDYWGCTNMLVANGNPLANKDDGSCLLSGTATTTDGTQSMTATSSVVATSTPSANVDVTLERHIELTMPTNATTSVSETTGQVLGASTGAFTSKLRLGSRGDEVMKLQKHLTDLGFYFGPITGYFGRLTSSAVRVFQAAHGLDSVGRVGPLTLAALNNGPVVGVTFAATTMEGKLLSSMP